MRLWVLDFIALIRFYKLRIGLALFIITLGYAALVVFILLNDATQAHMQHLFDDISKGRFVVHLIAKDYKDHRVITQQFSYPNLKDTITQSTQALPTHTIVPFKERYEKVRWGSFLLEAQLVLCQPSMLKALDVSAIDGRLLQEYDASDKVVMIGSQLANTIKGRGIDPLAEYLVIKGQYYKIVGILKQKINHPLIDFDLNRGVFIHLSQSPYFDNQPFQTLWVESGLSLTQAKESFRQYLRNVYGLVHVFIKDAEVYRAAVLRQVQLTMRIVKWVAAVNLSLGLLLLLALLNLLIQERLPEIGLRFCIGAQKKDILVQMTREAIGLCVIGAMMGWVLGFPMSYVIISKLDLKFVQHIYHLLWLMPASVICGLIAGCVPSILVIRKQPIELLS